MKNIIGILFLIAIISCRERISRVPVIDAQDLSASQIDSILTEFNFKYETPIFVDSSDQVLIPISTEILDKREKFSSDGYYIDDFPRYWNVLFYNKLTGENHLLTEEKIRISQIHTPGEDEDENGNILRGKILFELSDEDYNKDEILNAQDPNYLYATEIDGKRLTRLSPKNENLEYFQIVPKSNQIIMHTTRDINGDKNFDLEDEAIWYTALWVDNGWKLKEIIDSTGRKNIEHLYFEQWLKKKGK